MDVLYIELYEQFGAFDGSDLKTGTFTLTGDDAADLDVRRVRDGRS